MNFQELENELTEVERDRLRVLARIGSHLGTTEKERLNAQYRMVCQQLPVARETLLSLQSGLISFERRLLEFEQWTSFHDPESEMVCFLIIF